jgi:putative ABC transport system permease protein
MLGDLRLAVRRLVRQPRFTLLGVVILTLGVGAATAVFSMVNALAFRPLPFAGAERIVQVRRHVAGRSLHASVGIYRQLQARGQGFEAFGPFLFGDRTTLTVPGQPPEILWTVAGSVSFFSLLGVSPMLGRGFLPEEDQPGPSDVVLLSAKLWQTRFGADPAVIGRRVQLGPESATVVGVMPPAFTEPTLWWSRADLFRPLGMPGPTPGDDGAGVHLLARIKPGVGLAAAQAQASAIVASMPDAQRNQVGVDLQPLRETIGLNETSRDVIWMTLALAAFVFLIAVVNLAGVQLARLAARGHETAIRFALGASRGRLVRQMVIESLLLSATGGLFGVLLADWCMGLLAPRLIVGTAQVTVGVPAALDGRIVAFALALVVLTAVIMGTLPAWLMSGTAMTGGLRRGDRGSTDRSQPRLRRALVTGEVALALILLTGGGLFTRGLHLLRESDPGFRPHSLLTATVTLPSQRYDTPAGRFTMLERVRERSAALPGVQSSALASWLPLANYTTRSFRESFAVEGATAPPTEAAPLMYVNAVSLDYFSTMGIPVRQGRAFLGSDRPDGEPVVIINEAMARQFWPDGSAVGKRIRSLPGQGGWRTVVGVVGDVRFAGSLETPLTPFQTYRPMSQTPAVSAVLSLRAAGAPGALAPGLRRALAELDAELGVWELFTAEALIERALTNLGMTGWVLLGFAGLGLLLAGLGVYGLFAGFVVDRTREIGVRVALGARSGQVVWLVLRGGLRLALVGAAVGVAGAVAAARVLRAVAPELPGSQPGLVAALSVLLVAVALFACWLPARRAAALDPVIALRQP